MTLYLNHHSLSTLSGMSFSCMLLCPATFLDCQVLWPCHIVTAPMIMVSVPKMHVVRMSDSDGDC